MRVFYLEVDEYKAWQSESETFKNNDRRDFVHNVGVLASQTREEVSMIKYQPHPERAIIVFNGGSTREVNIFGDSYCAIVRDIFKALQ